MQKNISKKHSFIYILLIYILLIKISVAYDEFNILEFNSFPYATSNFAFNENGDMIVKYLKDNHRLLYGLKQNGKYFFDKQLQFKEIQIHNINFMNLNSKNIFISFIKDNTNKQYLLSLNKYTIEFYNLHTGEYIIKNNNKFLKNILDSDSLSVLSLNDNGGKKEYLMAYNFNQNYILQKLSFSDLNLEMIPHSNVVRNSIGFNNVPLSTFIIEDMIIVFYVNRNKEYSLDIYDSDLNILNDDDNKKIILDKINNFNVEKNIFSKCLHLKDRLAFFIYYKNLNTNIPTLKIGKINSDFSFSEKITKELYEYKFKTDISLNSLLKVNDERLIFIGLRENTEEEITILLLDLYNNYNNMIIREYEVNFNNRYNIDKVFTADIYNNLLVFSSNVLSSSQDNTKYSIFMIFGYAYAHGKDSIIDISECFLDDNINNGKNIIDTLIDNIKIENNIFGYEVIKDKIKLISIPDEILFYNKNNENNKLSNGDILNKNYIYKKNLYLIKGNEYYFLDYQIIVQEPEYNKFNSNSKKIIEYPPSNSTLYINQKPFFKQREFYGKTQSVKFKLTNDSINQNKYTSINQFRFLSEAQDIYNSIKTNLQTYSNNEFSQEIIVENVYSFQITTTSNEDKILKGIYNNVNDLSIIDLDECKKILINKNKNDIAEGTPLIILKYEIPTNITYQKNMQFEIFNPNTKKNIDLSVCENNPILLYIPARLNNDSINLYEDLKEKNYNLFDNNDSFYQDICSTYKSADGSDVLISDRRNDYFPNWTSPQSNCEYFNYSSDKNYLIYKCKPSKDNIDTEDINKYSGESNLTDFYKKMSNLHLKMLDCYKLVFSPQFGKNIGSILSLMFFLLNIILAVVYILIGISPLKLKIAKFIFEKPKVIHYDNIKTTNDNNININTNENDNNKIIMSNSEKTKNSEMSFPPKKSSSKKKAKKKPKMKDENGNNDEKEKEKSKKTKKTKKTKKKSKAKDEGENDDEKEKEKGK